jgi:hypothetical protein
MPVLDYSRPPERRWSRAAVATLPAAIVAIPLAALLANVSPFEDRTAVAVEVLTCLSLPIPWGAFSGIRAVRQGYRGAGFALAGIAVSLFGIWLAFGSVPRTK